MKTTKYSGELPSNPFSEGDRVFADVTVDGDDPFTFTENTAVDIASARLNTYIRVHGLIYTYEFRVVARNRILHFCSSWVAASFGRILPIAPRDIHRYDHVSVHIEPPWPLDFRLLIRANSESDADKIMSRMTSQQVLS